MIDSRRFLLTVLALTGLGGTLGHAQTPTGPTVAVEDTMFTELPEVLVSAPRVTLAEILDRVYQGELRRESLLEDQAYTQTARMLKDVGQANKTPELMMEHVQRIYFKQPDKVLEVTVREYEKKEKKDDESPAKPRASVTTSASIVGEEIVNFAFRPEARRDYVYRIEDRTVIGDRLIYQIAFDPKSSFDFENPSGRVWVDTNEFVIVRQELIFDRSPVPLIIKAVPRAVVERQQIDGHWVLHRVFVRLELTVPFPGWGRHFDLAILYDDYVINGGLDDALFSGEPLQLQEAP